MTRRNTAVHWLPQNHDSWTPAMVAFLDSETHTTTAGADEVERLRCWTARMVHRRHRRRQGVTETAEGTGQAEFAAVIDEWASTDKSLWLYGHNCGFDLVTTRLPVELAKLGWELSSRHAITGSAPWLIMHKGRQEAKETRGTSGSRAGMPQVKWQHTLTIADSFSVLPVRLEQLAAASGIPKPPLPAQDAGLDEWLARCHADTEILAWSVLTLMDWWEANDLGRWSISGAACAWNSYRHRIDPRDVLIDPDPEPVEAEHAACYGGRRDAFRVGRLPPGRYVELDFAGAYPTIAATTALPRKRLGKLHPKMAAAILDGRTAYGMLAACTIETDTPRWPLRSRGRVFYPVGRFDTVLAGPDIQAAHDLGALAAVGDGYFYSMSGHMQDWARWVLGVQAAADGGTPEPARIFAKAASRSACGKWAQRGWITEQWQGPPGDDWGYTEAFIAYSEATASITSLAGRYYLSTADQEGSHEFPAVLAWIEAHVRQRLCEVLRILPAAVVVQCDTDGVMVSVSELGTWAAAGFTGALFEGSGGDLLGRLCDLIAPSTAPLVMRVKREFGEAVVYGPQHVVLDGSPRFSGVPRSARRAPDGKWQARLWPGLSWQVQHGSGDGYVRPVQDYLVIGPYASGWVTEDGAVRPVETAVTTNGMTVILPWDQTRWAAAGDVLAADQASWAGRTSGPVTGQAGDQVG